MLTSKYNFSYGNLHCIEQFIIGYHCLSLFIMHLLSQNKGSGNKKMLH